MEDVELWHEYVKQSNNQIKISRNVNQAARSLKHIQYIITVEGLGETEKKRIL